MSSTFSWSLFPPLWQRVDFTFLYIFATQNQVCVQLLCKNLPATQTMRQSGARKTIFYDYEERRLAQDFYCCLQLMNPHEMVFRVQIALQQLRAIYEKTLITFTCFSITTQHFLSRPCSPFFKINILTGLCIACLINTPISKVSI